MRWKSYDGVAQAYSQVSAPKVFAGPARDLVRLLAPRAGAKVLDVGTGTGVAAQCARRAGAAVVVGLDLSQGMLVEARQGGLRAPVRGRVPGLPFAGGVFDAVIASFVLNHVAAYAEALADMAQVLRRGGKLGVTNWGPLDSEPRQYWNELAQAVSGKDALSRAVSEAVPCEDWFSDPAHLRQAFADAGFDGVEVQAKRYALRWTIAEFLANREVAVQARFLQATLAAAEWERFRERLQDAFAARYREPLEDTLLVYLCVGARRGLE